MKSTWITKVIFAICFSWCAIFLLEYCNNDDDDDDNKIIKIKIGSSSTIISSMNQRKYMVLFSFRVLDQLCIAPPTDADLEEPLSLIFFNNIWMTSNIVCGIFFYSFPIPPTTLLALSSRFSSPHYP